MRNWHTKVIKLQEAKNIIAVNNEGNPNLYVGVIEGKIEYSKIDDSTSKYENYNYKSANNHLTNNISGDRKVIYRERVDSSFYDENLHLDLNEMVTMTHTTCVAGIIAGKDIGDHVFGICPAVNIINGIDRNDTNQFEVSLLLGLVSEYSKANINSYYYENKILKKNTVGGTIDGTGYFSKVSNVVPKSAINDANDLSNKKCSIISCSYSLVGYSSTKSDNMPKEIADFVLQELFAYGRDGRGILTIFAAGNVDSNIDNENSGAVYSPKTLIVAASKVTLNDSNMNLYASDPIAFNENKASYSNYGKRIDICAPSCPVGKSANDEIEIYAPTAMNCGEIGDDDQIILVSVLHKSSNNRELTLNANFDAVLVGQSIEIGEPINFTHEVRFIQKVETTQFPSDPDPTINIKTKVTLSEALVFTKDSSLPLIARICFYKKSVTKISASQLTVENFNGIGDLQIPMQKAYLYSEDPTNINDFSVGMAVNIKNRLSSGNVIDLNENINLSRLTNLKLIPGQITTILKRTSEGSSTFIAKENSSLQGFFSGQQVFINEESVKRHLKFVSGVGAATRTQFSQLSSESDDEGNFPSTEYTIKSLAYGNMTSSFGGTSAATPIVSGVATLVLTANDKLNAAELKHILKITANPITTASYNDAPNDSEDYNYGYDIHKYYGTGRIDAEKAVKLAKNWHCTENGQPLPHPEVPVEKPRLEIADKLNGTVIESVQLTDPVDSPDIWVSELANSNTTVVAPFNKIETSKNQYINIRIRNTGNRNSFKECDLRVFVAFTNEINPAFPFPTMWYDQIDVKLLAIKEIPIISPNSETVIQIEWKDIAAQWNGTWNKKVSSSDGTEKRKRTYILAHISPFDGIDSDVSLANIRNNKHLTCKEIIVTHNGVSDGTASLSGNSFNFTVGSDIIPKPFEIITENVLITSLDTLIIKAIKKSRIDGTEEFVIFKKTAGIWGIEGTAPDWITFNSPVETLANNTDYKDVKFPHILNVNEEEQEIKMEVIYA